MIHATDKDAAISNSQIHCNNPRQRPTRQQKATQRTNRQNQRSYAKISDSTDACARSYTINQPTRYLVNAYRPSAHPLRISDSPPISDFLQYSTAAANIKSRSATSCNTQGRCSTAKRNQNKLRRSNDQSTTSTATKQFIKTV